MGPFRFSAVLCILLITSCVTIEEDPPIDSPRLEREEQKEYTSWRDLRRSLTDELDLPPLSDVVRSPEPGPSWIPDQLPSWVWLAESVDGSQLFLGAAYPHSSRRAELETCVVNAARQAARYQGVAAVVSSLQATFTEGRGFASDARMFYNEKLIPALVAEAEVRALHQDPGGSYALISFPSIDVSEQLSLTDQLSRGTGEPAWILSPPPVSNLLLGVGVAGGRLRFSDSIEAADEAAVGDILYQLAATIDVTYDMRTGNTGDAYFDQETYQYATAMVRGLRIVARWRNPRNGYFYSLAVLPVE